ncbi:response regulator [Dactylosporangium aurantiacum]|uniref:Response regulator n=1 Tax=Dactylosporangium aurantiacum TaxID=35754 RepID=A0A9Q9IPQ2_9ACTN|nr:response regulator [Dactylosporangium aurantiacum]MDG6103253.1 response regulator [Dactylosporangium aurantiacum]UWZ57755.1 response regulator [Dactylosporangium aurantiacum]
MAAVVVADDDPVVRQLVARMLRRCGHHVVTCDDGEQLLVAVRRHPPDVVVTDHQMPGLTGLAVVARLRQDPATAGIPVVVASGSVGPDEAAALLGDADRLLVKPFTTAQLRETVEDALRRRPFSPAE